MPDSHGLMVTSGWREQEDILRGARREAQLKILMSPWTLFQNQEEDFGFRLNEWDQDERKQWCSLGSAVDLLSERRAANADGRIVDRTLCLPSVSDKRLPS